MWYGKLAPILYVFTFATLFMTYLMNQVFNDPVLANTATSQSLTILANSFQYSGTPNTTLIFGDFMAAFTILINLFTGGIFNVVFGAHGFTQSSGIGILSGDPLNILMGLLFDSATLFFILYIVSNRSI